VTCKLRCTRICRSYDNSVGREALFLDFQVNQKLVEASLGAAVSTVYE
jgi:hypothetical protein